MSYAATANTGITIRINADGSDAAAKLQAFFNGVNGSMVRMSGLASVLSHELAALATVAGFTALAKSSFNFADSLGKVSQSVGTTVKDLAGMAYAAERSEVGMEALKVGLRSFADYMVKTGQGSANMKDALLEQARIFQEMPDGAAKAAKAVDLFGRSGLNMIPFLNEGPAALEKLFVRGTELSGVTDAMSKSANEFNDALTDLKWASEGLAGALGSALLPKLTEVIKTVTDGIVRFREWSKESETLRLAMEGAATALAVFAGYKASLGGTRLLAAFIGAGSINSLADFIAALRLLPAAAASAAASLGPLALAIAGVTAALVTGLEGWKAWEAQADAVKSWDRLIQGNNALADSIRAVAKARHDAGAMSAQEFVDVNDRTLAAQTGYPDEAASKLRAIAKSLQTGFGADKMPKQWTKEQLELENKLLEIEMQRSEILRGKSEMHYREKGDVLFLKVQQTELDRQEELSMQKRSNAHDAMEQHAITQLENDQVDLQVRKELLAVDLARLDLTERIHQKQVSDISSDWRLTDADKYRKLAAISTPQERQTMGPDPSSWSQQWQAASVATKNMYGTFQQFATSGVMNTIKDAVHAVSDGIAAAVMGTKSWGQAFAQVGSQILSQLITVAAQALIVAAILTPLGLGFAGGGGAGGFLGIFGGARAEGGPVQSGRGYVVGERGPEWFVPSSSGQVVSSARVQEFVNSRPAGDVNVSAAPVHVVVVNDRSELKRFLESTAGERIVVNHLGKNRLNLGLDT